MTQSSLFQRLGGREGILALLRPFYADVKQHRVLGPIFLARIQDWPAHLEKIAEFWARHMGGESRYAGGFGRAHLALGIGPEHVATWLELWDFNARRALAEPEANEVSALAHRLGQQLRLLLAGRTSLSIGPAPGQASELENGT